MAAEMIRVGNTLTNIIDTETGEYVTYDKTITFVDGTIMTDLKCNKLYRKLGSEYFKRNFSGSIHVKWFGAKADGVSDDSIAIQEALNFAFASKNIVSIDFATEGSYLIENDIIVDLSELGEIQLQGVNLNGNNALVKLKGGGFKFRAAAGAQNDTKINISNFFFNTDNITRPNAISSDYCSFVNIEKCYFLRTAIGVSLKNAGMSRITDCFFFGCTDAIKTYRMRDTYIRGCHAFACDRGITGEGINDVGTDGNLTITECIINGCTEYNVKLKRVYAPIFANCEVEVSPYNLIVESSSYGKLSNIFFGPGSIEFKKVESNSPTNDYWNLSNLDIQGRVLLSYTPFTVVTNVMIHGVFDVDASTGVLVIDNCPVLNLSGLTARFLDNSVYSIRIVNSNSSVLTNLILDRSIYLADANTARENITIDSSHIAGNIISSDGLFSEKEKYSYRNTSNNINVKVNDGYMFPKVIASGDISPNITQDFNLTTLIPYTDSSFKVKKMTIGVVHGAQGSVSTALYSVLVRNNGLYLSQIQNTGSVGSGESSVLNNTTLRLKNNSGDTITSYYIRVIDNELLMN